MDSLRDSKKAIKELQETLEGVEKLYRYFNSKLKKYGYEIIREPDLIQAIPVKDEPFAKSADRIWEKTRGLSTLKELLERLLPDFEVPEDLNAAINLLRKAGFDVSYTYEEGTDGKKAGVCIITQTFAAGSEKDLLMVINALLLRVSLRVHTND